MHSAGVKLFQSYPILVSLSRGEPEAMVTQASLARYKAVRFPSDRPWHREEFFMLAAAGTGASALLLLGGGALPWRHLAAAAGAAEQTAAAASAQASDTTASTGLLCHRS